MLNMAPLRNGRDRSSNQRNAGENIPTPDPTLEAVYRIAQTVGDQAVITNQIMSELQRQDRKTDVTHIRPLYQGMSEFRSNNPPVFNGGMNLDIAEKWIQQLDKIFGTMICTEEQKVTYGTFMLQG